MRRMRHCPFCDAPGAVYTRGERKRLSYPAAPSFRPYCIDKRCVAHKMYRYYDTEEEAIAAWNRRAKGGN